MNEPYCNRDGRTCTYHGDCRARNKADIDRQMEEMRRFGLRPEDAASLLLVRAADEEEE